MATQAVRARDKDTLARFLGWFSVGLGSAQLAAPRLVCRLVGASGDDGSGAVMRALGFRELALGLGILMRARPTTWLWTRVAGDGLDLALLGLTAAKRAPARPNGVRDRERRGPDCAGCPREPPPEPPAGRAGMLVRKAVTINRPRSEVEEAWMAAEDLRRKAEEQNALVTFDEAPGNRGTELAVEFRYAPPGGDFGAAVQKVTGSDLATELSDDLRRRKQQIETGEIIRSDSTPAGHVLADHVKQRLAQPLAEAVR